MDQMQQIQQLQEWIDEQERIVFFGGAGVSTESGVPDFRSVDGLYHQKFDYPPETILSHSFFMRNPEAFYDFYRQKILIDGILPNAAHYKLAELEAAGKLKAVITQNIDGLHQLAGSKAVYELHGTVSRNFCMKCHREFGADYVRTADPVPRCDACGGIIKPDVVLYEEMLDEATMAGAIRQIAQADMMIVGGTSLVVYPAAGLLDYFQGKRLVLINKGETGRDSLADLRIDAPIGEVLSKIRV